MWEKNGIQFDGYINGVLVSNPTKEMLLEAGYVWVEPIITPTNNEQIRLLRQQQYQMRSDHLFMAYQKYTAMNELTKAEQARTQWLEEIAKIDEEYPYVE